MPEQHRAVMIQRVPTEDEKKMWKYIEHIYGRIMPMWAPVAEGYDKNQPWMTGRSTDCLTFFSAWLLMYAPIDKLEHFLVSDAPGMKQELSDNVSIYVDNDKYLKNVDPDSILSCSDLFRLRMASNPHIDNMFRNELSK
jgi:hypothetical protein